MIDTLKTDEVNCVWSSDAGFAQSESESISKNITWSVRKKFEGRNSSVYVQAVPRLQEGRDGEPEECPSEATIVERIFNLIWLGKPWTKSPRSCRLRTMIFLENHQL